MLKQQSFGKKFFTALAGLALLIAITGSSGIVADELGLEFTPQTFACQDPSGSGGGC